VITGIDHLVIAVRSVDAAADALERDLGLAFTGGGRHEAMGTYNRLAFLGDTYLELIGVFDAKLVRSSAAFKVGGAALALLETGREGLATYALATDDMAGDVRRLRATGSPIGEPVAGSRQRDDGEVVRWVAAFPELGPEGPPFLIEHEPVGAEWGPEARAVRAAFRHPGGGRLRLATLELPVVGAPAVADAYGAALGIAFSEHWRATVGEQQVVLRDGGSEPVVELAGGPGTVPLDLVRLGLRWRRERAAPTPGRRRLPGPGGAPPC
jgi:hypothetical protein